MNFRCQSWLSVAVCLISTGLQVGLAQDKASQVDAGDSVRSSESKREIRLPRATPESQGVSSEAIAKFVRAADEKVNSMHSVMILRHGKVIAEAWWAPEDASKPHVLWSLSKSFTSTAVGLVVEEGKLSIEDRVVGFFPDDLPAEPTENLRKMQVKDLLTMSTGHADEPNVRQSQDWIKSFLAHPLPHPPGTFFRYNTPATFMQSAIVQKVTGKTVVDYLQSRLFDPLGIQPPRWDTNPQGISLGGYGLFLKTEDIAKFGQLYLQNGKWEGKQLIPTTWVQQATSKQVSNGDNPSSDWNQGYGFQFWRCRHNAFRGDGKDGQFCIVMPDQDAVVVMTANTTNMQAQLSLVWDHLLEGFQEGAMAEDPKNQEALSGLCKNLRATR
ncbi:MAG: serine hydrolase domain-containing protein [Planctomycetota bacterium]|jgi:CubicO group peptidase (beta-lactamase class C family)